MTRMVILAAVILAACVDGAEIIGPSDARYTAICENGEIVPDTACLPVTTIRLEIENPNPQDTTTHD